MTREELLKEAVEHRQAALNHADGCPDGDAPWALMHAILANTCVLLAREMRERWTVRIHADDAEEGESVVEEG